MPSNTWGGLDTMPRAGEPMGYATAVAHFVDAVRAGGENSPEARQRVYQRLPAVAGEALLKEAGKRKWNAEQLDAELAVLVGDPNAEEGSPDGVFAVPVRMY